MARKAAAQVDPEATPPEEPAPELDKDIEVEISESEPDVSTPTATEGTSDTPVAAQPVPEDDVAALRKRLAEMEQAERLAVEGQRTAQQQLENSQQQLSEAQRSQRQSQWQAWEAAKTEVINRAGAAQSIIDATTQEIEAASASGDKKAEIDAFRRLSRAEAQLERAEAEKAQMEAREEQWKRQQQRQPQRQQPQQRVQQPPSVEQIIAGAAVPEQAKAWLRAHPDYITDPTKNAQLVKMHNVAEYQAGGEFTPAYFERIEVLLGLRQEQKPTNGHGNEPPVSAPTAPRQTAPVSAPVNREAPSMTTGRAPASTSKVHLSKDEVEIAKASKWSEDEPDSKAIERYAKNKQKMLNMKKTGDIQ